MNITKGQIVELKPEWMDAGDENFTFRAVEDSGLDSDRVLVSADEHQDWPIVPMETIRKEMIARLR